MLKQEDFCTEKTIAALCSVGYQRTESHVSLYEAQKFLRDEKYMLVEPLLTTYLNHGYRPPTQYRVRLCTIGDAIYNQPLIGFLKDDNGKEHVFDKYEDALQYGIESATKTILALQDIITKEV